VAARVTWTTYGRPALDALWPTVATLKEDDVLHPVTVNRPEQHRRHLARGFHPTAVGFRLATVHPRSALEPRPQAGHSIKVGTFHIVVGSPLKDGVHVPRHCLRARPVRALVGK
jgi:hypothetical protein